MVDDPVYQHLMAWTPSGQSFVIADANEFSRDMLPRYFKHSNYSSFVRQLNLYAAGRGRWPWRVASGEA